MSNNTAETDENKHHRLSDEILKALEFSLEQKDVQVSEQLVNALELAMTRYTGGKEYVERREYPERVDAALRGFNQLKKEKGLE